MAFIYKIHIKCLIITENFGKLDYRLHWRGCGNYSASYIAEEKTKTNFMCPTLCDPMDYSPPGSSVHGILQVRILEWVAIFFSRGSSWPRDQTQVSHIADRCFNLWATREALVNYILEKEGIFKLNYRLSMPVSFSL